MVVGGLEPVLAAPPPCHRRRGSVADPLRHRRRRRCNFGRRVPHRRNSCTPRRALKTDILHSPSRNAGAVPPPDATSAWALRRTSASANRSQTLIVGRRRFFANPYLPFFN